MTLQLANGGTLTVKKSGSIEVRRNGSVMRDAGKGSYADSLAFVQRSAWGRDVRYAVR